MPLGEDLVPFFETIYYAYATLTPVDPSQEQELLPLTRYLRERGRATAAPDFLFAQAYMQFVTRPAVAALSAYDAILTPTLAQPPRPVGYFDEVDPAENFERQKRFTPWTAIYNVAGLPAVSVPLHWSAEGLPIGVMLAGRMGGEATLISLSAQLEEARPWKDRHPPIWGRPDRKPPAHPPRRPPSRRCPALECCSSGRQARSGGIKHDVWIILEPDPAAQAGPGRGRGDRGQPPDQELRPADGRGRRVLQRRERRGVRLPRPQRGGQDDDGADPRHADRADRRVRRGGGPPAGPGHRGRDPPAHLDHAGSPGAVPPADGRREPGVLRAAVRPAAARAADNRGPGGGRPRRPGPGPHREPVQGPAAAGGAGPLPAERSGGHVPRRADLRDWTRWPRTRCTA